MIKLEINRVHHKEILKTYNLPLDSEFLGYVIYDVNKCLFLSYIIDNQYVMTKKPLDSLIFKDIKQAANMLQFFSYQVHLAGLFKNSNEFNIVTMADNLTFKKAGYFKNNTNNVVSIKP